MAFQNDLERHVTSIVYNEETKGWDIVFTDRHGVKHNSAIDHIPYAGNNVALALQIIIANYCVNNSDEANLWTPTSALEEVIVQRTEFVEVDAIIIKFQNGLEIVAQNVGPVVDYIQVIENLVVHGVDYYNKDAGCKFRDIEMDDLDAGVRAVKMFESQDERFGVTLLLQDHAHQPVTDDQIARSVPHYLDAVMMLAGMFNTRIHASTTDNAHFIPSDFTLPAFEIKHHDWFKPALVVHDDMSAMLFATDGTLLATLND